MRKSLLFFLAVLFPHMAVHAADGDTFTVGDFEFNITSEAEAYVNLKKYTGSSATVDIPATVTYSSKEYRVACIGAGAQASSDGAFYNNLDINEVNIADGVKYIERYAFYRCSNLKKISIGNQVEEIWDNSFGFCSSLETVEIPASVRYIRAEAFRYCNSLRSVDVDAANPFYSSQDGMLLSKHMGRLYLIPSAISECVIPEGVGTIGEYTCCGSSKLTSIVLPSTLTLISNHAFSMASDLVYIEIKADTPPEIKEGAFSAASCYGTVYVPKGSVDAYKEADGWNTFEYIEEIGGPEVAENSTFESGDFVYRVISKDEKTLDAVYYLGESDVVTLPGKKMCNGEAYTVKYLSKTAYYKEYSATPYYAFSGRTDITKVTLPATITEFGYGPFNGCSGLTYVYMPDNLEIIGVAAFRDCSALTNVYMPATLKSIGNFALAGCESVTRLNLPDGVEEIGWNAFQGCASVEYVSLPASLKVVQASLFDRCSALTSVIIKAAVETIEPTAFNYCPALTKITVYNENPNFTTVDGAVFSKDETTLVRVPGGYTYFDVPESVTTIGTGAFMTCDKLTRLTLPSNLAVIDMSAFTGCSAMTEFNLPESVVLIGVGAFTSCSSLETIVIPQEVKMIANLTFSGCESLKSVTFSPALTYIGPNAFQNCTSLESVELPESVTEIGASCFSGCSSLTSAKLSDAITELPDYVFRGCSSLSSFTFPENLKKIGNYALAGCGFKDIAIPEGIEEIGDYAFQFCGLMESVVVPETVTVLNMDCFSGCSSLVNVTLPESLEEIRRRCFWNCTSLQKIKLQGNLKNIGFVAFLNDENLRTITTMAVEPPEIEMEEGFRNVPQDAIVYVPKGTVEAYRAAPGWNYFSDFREMETGIDDISASDEDSDEEAVYYNIQGHKVAPENLTPGVYIRQKGGVTTIVAVQ